MRMGRRNDLLAYLMGAFWGHKSPTTINFYWNSGSYASAFFGVQIFTGVIVSMWYINNLIEIFPALEAVYREIPNGWFFRYIHAMTASWFFMSVYIHMYKNMYYSNFMGPKTIVWNIGVTIYFLMIVTAFLGYTLPYGQMSLWAATVITNLVTAVPIIGDDLCVWIRGSYVIGPITIPRFFALHVILPFVIIAMVMLHLHYLHKKPSTETKGNSEVPDQATLTPYFLWRDAYGMVFFLVAYAIGGLTFPNIFVDMDNYTLANMLVTPEHITPEWYLCSYYAILRSIDNKLMGILLSMSTIVILYAVPGFFGSTTGSRTDAITVKMTTILLILTDWNLIWLGSQPIEPLTIYLTWIMTGSFILSILFLSI